MDWVKYYIDHINIDCNSLKIVLYNILKRKLELTPLISECKEKNMCLKTISQDIYYEYLIINIILKHTQLNKLNIEYES
jgi:hypothetical protein